MLETAEFWKRGAPRRIAKSLFGGFVVALKPLEGQHRFHAGFKLGSTRQRPFFILAELGSLHDVSVLRSDGLGKLENNKT